MEGTISRARKLQSGEPTLSASERGAGSSFMALSVAYTRIGIFEPSVSTSVNIAS